MLTFREIPPLKKQIQNVKKEGKSVGFVPTMGNLHEGHLSLIKKCSDENDICVVSIYVNPAQFGLKEDFNSYPRTLENDLELAKNSGCSIAFIPENNTMYPDEYSTYVTEERLSLPMEGKVRPGHFRGVTTVVLKLFNIVEPEISYFGQKDAQQAIVIKKMVRDLNINTEIKILPTVREKTGLAMSSRNNYLNRKDRERASIIYKSLKNAQKLFKSGVLDSDKIVDEALSTLKDEKDIKVDYIEIRSVQDLKPVDKIEIPSILAVSASFKNVHLIDNIVLKS